MSRNRIAGMFCGPSTWLVGAVLLAMVGCLPRDEPPTTEADPDLPARDVAAPIQTDTLAYELEIENGGWAADIAYLFTNVTPDTIYAVNCNGALTIGVERQVNGGWETFWAPVVNQCLSPPIEIPPSGRTSGRVELWGAAPGSNAGPQFPDTHFDGVYRLVWWNVVHHYNPQPGSFGLAVPKQFTVSNAFVLRAAP